MNFCGDTIQPTTPGFSLSEKEVTNKQERRSRMKSVVIDLSQQSWRELVFTLISTHTHTEINVGICSIYACVTWLICGRDILAATSIPSPHIVSKYHSLIKEGKLILGLSKNTRLVSENLRRNKIMYITSNYLPTQIFINYRGGFNICPQTPLHVSL